MVVSDGGSTGPVIYIDRSDVRETRWGELNAGIRTLVEFVDSHQPRLPTYGFYLDEDAQQMTVVSVHPDSASLERHMATGGPEFKKLALGGGGVVTLQEQFAGFDRLNTPSRP